jgi:hypothetical protein
MNNKKYSRHAAKMITDARNNAMWFLEDGWDVTDEKELFELIPLPVNKDLDNLAICSQRVSNSYGRISFAQFIGAEPYAVNLVDCWLARCLGAKFRERSMLKVAEEAQSLANLEAEGVDFTRTSTELISLAVDLWKLYTIDKGSHIAEFVPIFEVYDLRGDSTQGTREFEMPTDIAICLTLLIGRGDASLEKVCTLLEPISVFEGIARFWEDDELFAQWTEKSAQWYLEYCPKHYGDLDQFASVPTDVLVPSWITAFDKFRQVKGGRPSCLGSNELFDISKKVFDAAKAQNHPRIPSLVKAEKYYEELFGTEPFNPRPFWFKFLGHEE